MRKRDTFLAMRDESGEFKVVETDPAEYCIVAPDTRSLVKANRLTAKTRTF